MTTPAGPSNVHRLIRAGVACAGVDGLWAVVLSRAYGRSVLSLWQDVAAVPFGPSMRDGGVATALVGVGLHVTVAFTWSGVLLGLYVASARLRRALSSWTGAVLMACVFGSAIWVVMSAAVIPAFTHQPLVVTYRWWIQLAGHAMFVGAPIVWGVRSSSAGTVT